MSGSERSVDTTLARLVTAWVYWTVVVIFLGTVPSVLMWYVQAGQGARLGLGQGVARSAFYAVMGGCFGLMCGLARRTLFHAIVGLNIGAALGLCFAGMCDSRFLNAEIPQAFFGALALALICGAMRYRKDDGALSFWKGCAIGGVALAIMFVVLAVGVVFVFGEFPRWVNSEPMDLQKFFAGSVPPTLGFAFVVYALLQVQAAAPTEDTK